MTRRALSTRRLPGGFLLAGLLTIGAPNPISPDALAGLVWRNIGPFRAGRVASVSGAIGEPGVFYAGMPAGGIWKTGNAGVTWEPIFDSIKAVSSVGAIEVAPSDTNIIYAGTGDIITGGSINEGNGVYKSVDAGRTWRHLGLDATKQIPSILVDPRDPNLVMVAAQGDVHRKSESRGVFRSTDGGKSWTRTLFINDSTGVEKLARAFDRPEVILATTVRHYNAPNAPRGGFGGGGPPTGPTGTALYKSNDEGLTWHEITGGGLPRLTGRTSVAVAMHTDARRMFLIGSFGLYRSDDGGDSWRRMAADDPRIANGQGGYNCGVYVSPGNPDIVYTINTSSYVSTDGGRTFTGWKGAPGGDDPQQMWIDPTDGQRILLGMDQGATISLDGGRTWSTWYNQSTDQVYHLSADSSWPYWVYAPQQDAGAIRTRSRGNFGAITPMDWNPVGGWEWGTIIADPTNPDLVYASGAGILRISYPSEQIVNLSPAVDPDQRLRATSSNPIAFAPWNPRELLAGFQYLMATTDGGMHWSRLSPDLGYPGGQTPPPETATRAPGTPAPPPPGIIESFSPSTVARGLIWVGTNNGLVKLTRDEGKTWEDVTIPGLPETIPRAFIATIDASHHDAAEAYAAIDFHGSGDYTPWLYRTRDYGKTWTRIVNGLPTDLPGGSFTRVIRADPKRAGLLFTGTESSVYVSFDDGDSWQSLGLNLPTTSVRDMTFKDNDLLVGTYGRGIWILDDISPLRQLTGEVAREPVHLFAPGDAIRVRRNVNNDTPFPPEVPHALNPPDGAIIYYTLAAKPAGEITLDVLDPAGKPVRHLSSAPIAPVAEAARPPVPNFWLATPTPLPTAVGLNRASWDLRYDDPPATSHSWEINANPGLTPASPEGPLAPPGVYTLKLTVNGKGYTRTLTVKNDPRSPATLADLGAQHALAMKLYEGIKAAWDGYQQVEAMRAAVTAVAHSESPADVATAATAFQAKLNEVGGTPGGRGRFGGGGFGAQGGPPPAPTFLRVNGRLAGLLGTVDNGDVAPTESMLKAFAGACVELGKAAAAWRALNETDLAAFNAVLQKNGLKPVPAAAGPTPPPC